MTDIICQGSISSYFASTMMHLLLADYFSITYNGKVIQRKFPGTIGNKKDHRIWCAIHCLLEKVNQSEVDGFITYALDAISQEEIPSTASYIQVRIL